MKLGFFETSIHINHNVFIGVEEEEDERIRKKLRLSFSCHEKKYVDWNLASEIQIWPVKISWLLASWPVPLFF